MKKIKNKEGTPHYQLPELPSVNPEKKISNFPKVGGRKRVRDRTRIIPAHRAIFENYKEQGFKNLGKAVRKTKVYSEQTAQRVHNITVTQSWKNLMNEYMPEEFLAQRHAEILDKRDHRKVNVQDEDGNLVLDGSGSVVQEEVDDGPNAQAVNKALEMAYKLRGSFKKDDDVAPSTVMYNLFYKPDVREKMKVFEEGIKQSLINEIARKNQKDMDQEEENAANLASNDVSERIVEVEEGDRGKD